MFGQTTISYVKNCNNPIWNSNLMREVPGLYDGLSHENLYAITEFHRISGRKMRCTYRCLCYIVLLHPVGGQSMKNSLLIAGTLRPFVADQLCMDSWERCPCKNVFRMSCRKSKAIWMCFHLCISSEFKWLLNIISMNLHVLLHKSILSTYA